MAPARKGQVVHSPNISLFTFTLVDEQVRLYAHPLSLYWFKRRVYPERAPVVSNLKRLFLLTFLLALVPLPITAQSKRERLDEGIFAAPPELISYERIAQLLDGIYEDVFAKLTAFV
jgi:hypothetical protein